MKGDKVNRSHPVAKGVCQLLERCDNDGEAFCDSSHLARRVDHGAVPEDVQWAIIRRGGSVGPQQLQQ